MVACKKVNTVVRNASENLARKNFRLPQVGEVGASKKTGLAPMQL